MLENSMVVGDYYDEDLPVWAQMVCEGCEGVFSEGRMQKWSGEWRCPDCRPLCPVCKDVEVLTDGEFCETCAMWALGVDV